MAEWKPDPLVVDGTRECVELVAELPRSWTTDGERLVLFALACDAYFRESAPGLDNLSSWTGMHRRSVARVLETLQLPTQERPALLRKTKKSRGGPKVTSSYLLLLPIAELGQNSDLTVTEQGPLDTDNSDLTVSSTVTVSAPPLPSPKDPSPSPEQLAVAKVLGLKDDDERLSSVEEMLKEQNVKSPAAWIKSLSTDDLLKCLEDAHAPVRAAQLRAIEADKHRCPHGKVNGIRTGQCETCMDELAEAAAS